MLKFKHSDFDEIKKLKSTRKGSYYIDTIMFWSSKHYSIDTNVLESYLEIFLLYVDIPDWFIKKYDLKQYHINLIRRTYLETSDFQNDDGSYDDGVSMGYKRPYGNSNVPDDILEEYERIMGLPYSTDVIGDEDGGDLRYDWLDKNEEFIIKIHDEVMFFIDKMIAELSLTSLEWVNIGPSWGRKWEPTEEGKKQYQKLLREKKLNRIVE